MTTKTIMTFDEYRNSPGVNWSTLKHFFKSPAHVREHLDNPAPESDAMRLGTLQHMALLEPDRLRDECIAAPDFGSLRKNDFDGTTTEQGKANKEAKAEFEAVNAGKIIIPAKDFESLIGMSKAAYAHDESSELLKSIVATEHPLFWTDRNTGVDCKGLLDLISDRDAIVDIKTTDDCRYISFQRKAAQFHYFGQQAYYLRGAAASGLAIKKAVWIAIESKAPYAVRCYYLSDLNREACDEVTDMFLRRYKVCSGENTWPAYQEAIQALDAPDWYMSMLKANL